MIETVQIAMITEHTSGQMGFPRQVKTIHSKQTDYQEVLEEFDNQKMKNRGFKVYISEIEIDVMEEE